MAWIQIVPEDEAGDELAALYASHRDPRTGGLDEILTVHSLDPAGMRGHYAIYRAAMSGTRSLRKRDREMVGVVVSAVNECHY